MPRSNSFGLDISTDDDEYETLPDTAPKTGICPECGADMDAKEDHDSDCSASTHATADDADADDDGDEPDE